MNSLPEDVVRIIFQYDPTYHIIYKKTIHNIKFKQSLENIKNMYYKFICTNCLRNVRNVRNKYCGIITINFINKLINLSHI